MVSNTDGDSSNGVVRPANDVGRQQPSLAAAVVGGGGTECLTWPVKHAGTILAGRRVPLVPFKGCGVLDALPSAHGKDGTSQSWAPAHANGSSGSFLRLVLLPDNRAGKHHSPIDTNALRGEPKLPLALTLYPKGTVSRDS